MPVSERFMQLGDWEVKLIPETPLSVRQAIDRYDQIVVTPSRSAAAAESRSALIGTARYRGPVLEVSDDRLSVSGQGMAHFLTFEASVSYGPPAATVWDWDDYMADWDDVLQSGFTNPGITAAATVDVPTTTWPDTVAGTSDDIPNNFLDAIVFVAGVLDVEWYVTADATFYSGGQNSNSLFTVTTPTVILTRGQSGRDIDLIGLELVSWNVTEDSWDQINRAEVYNSLGFASTSAAPLVYAADGTTGTRLLIEESDTINNANDGTKRAEAMLVENAARRTIEVSVNTYDPGRWMKPGDYVYAYDAINRVHDSANGVTYHGVHLHPEKLRLYGMTWPIREGMGVYLLAGSSSADPQVVDLTDYVVWEDGDCSLEVDAPRRSYDQ